MLINERKRDAERMQKVVDLQARLRDAQSFLVTPTRQVLLEGTPAMQHRTHICSIQRTPIMQQATYGCRA